MKFFFQKVILQLMLRISKKWYLKSIGVKHGKNCKIVALSCATFGTEPYLISLGDHVEVSYEVRFITHDGSMWISRDTHPESDVIGKIEIGNNVFIGARTIILPNTRIGDNVVIGAGSVLKGEYNSGGVYAGVPARFIKDTDSYLADKRNNCLPTKGLSKKEKKTFLIKHFYEE